jgi:hypothetical protein
MWVFYHLPIEHWIKNLTVHDLEKCLFSRNASFWRKTNNGIETRKGEFNLQHFELINVGNEKGNQVTQVKANSVIERSSVFIWDFFFRKKLSIGNSCMSFCKCDNLIFVSTCANVRIADLLSRWHLHKCNFGEYDKNTPAYV